MLNAHCPSTTRVFRLLRFGWLASVALLAPPALAADGGHSVVEEGELTSESWVSDTITPEPVATAGLQCAPFRLATSGVISPATPPTATKASAILGGEMSSLDRIRLAQSGSTMPSVALLQAKSLVTAERENGDNLDQDLVAYQPPVDTCRENQQFSAAPSATNDDRLILGSLRLSIRKTPFDQKWSRVSQAGSVRGLKRWLQRAGVSAAADRRSQIPLVNSWVNAQIAYADDSALYQQSDFWASSRETLRRGKGDCEDYAILKMDLLAAMGIDRDKMILVVARDLVRNTDHAVLVVQLDSGSVVLDNATDSLLDGRLPNDYRPIMSFASNGKWLHGYATAAAQPQPAATNTIEPAMAEPVVTIAALSVPLVPVTLLSVTALAGN
jgi:predicted transglutaminase-like cysteine proteinase